MVIWGLLTKLTNFAFLSLAVFAHFDTFPDGWVGGWVGGWLGGWMAGMTKTETKPN